MAILTNKRAQYGGAKVTTKYAPLEDITYVNSDIQYYSALLTNRYTLLQNRSLIQPLNLTTPNWANIIANEAKKESPLIVISSNRSEWIYNGILSGETQLNILGLTSFDNPSDFRALTAKAGQKQSPPIYCPKRIGPNPKRNVYIVVHQYEYNTYKNQLSGVNGITVVGWQFTRPNPPNTTALVGFGASRFAAIEFCKELRRAGNNPWNYAWLFDDNVVSLTNFPGYTAIEKAMDVRTTVCSGFHGGVEALNISDICKEAINELAAGRGKQYDKIPDPTTENCIVQQASVWNIKYLTENYLNFSPIYITSAEDLSITKYFDNQKIPYKWYKGIGVRKETTSYDEKKGAQFVKSAREFYAKLFSDAESTAVQGVNPPPPVEVQPKEPTDGGIQTLAKFVIDRVLPNSQMKDTAASPIVQNNAKCQAVEQITCGAIEEKVMTVQSMKQIFSINGQTDYPVTRRDNP